jgi:hypothetical protein
LSYSSICSLQHSCSVRFEICNFNAASLCDKIIPFAPRSQSSRKRAGCEPLMPNVSRKCPESHA